MATVTDSVPSDAPAGKENVPLTQTTLSGSKKGEGRKRTITLASGDEHDVTNAKLPVTRAVVEALRQRVLELEDELEGQPATKRARTSASTSNAVASTSANASTSTAAAAKADEKKRKMQIKKIFDRLKKECKADGVKFQGTPKTIKFDEVFEASEFETIFNGMGVLIQPTPTNKPKSTVTIITFNKEQVLQFFGSEFKGLKGNLWTRGGGPSFSRSNKVGSTDVVINSFHVNYSKNGMKCSLKFEVSQTSGFGMGCGYGWVHRDDWDEDDY